MLSDDNLAMARALNDIAAERGQTLAQMAIAWVLREQGEAGKNSVASALIGASSVQQLDANLQALDNLEFSPEELKAIDGVARDAGVNIWAEATKSRTHG